MSACLPGHPLCHVRPARRCWENLNDHPAADTHCSPWHDSAFPRKRLVKPRTKRFRGNVHVSAFDRDASLRSRWGRGDSADLPKQAQGVPVDPFFNEPAIDDMAEQLSVHVDRLAEI